MSDVERGPTCQPLPTSPPALHIMTALAWTLFGFPLCFQKRTPTAAMCLLVVLTRASCVGVEMGFGQGEERTRGGWLVGSTDRSVNRPGFTGTDGLDWTGRTLCLWSVMEPWRRRAFIQLDPSVAKSDRRAGQNVVAGHVAPSGPCLWLALF